MILAGLFYLFVFVASVLVLLKFYSKKFFSIWKTLNVPHQTPSFPLGSFDLRALTKPFGEILKEFYNDFPNERFFGIWMFLKPMLLIRDPELVKTIFVKDFMTFHDRGVYYNEEDDPLSAHLFAIEGSKWKDIRAQLTPTFTSGKMKMMFPMLLECSEDLKEVLSGPAERKESVEVKDIVARFTTDVISLCAFGIRTSSLKNPDDEFRKMGKKSVEPNLRNFFMIFLQFGLTDIAQLIKMKVFPKDVTSFFMNAVRETMTFRETNNVKRNDFMELLIQLKNIGMVEGPDGKGENGKIVRKKLTFEEAAAEAFVFFIAGFETSSSAVQCTLLELALNPDIQEKLRNEISDALGAENKLTYELVHNLPYLGKVIDETLRKYPVVPSLQRECNKDYRIPDSDVVIPKGTFIHIPIYGMQMDPKYYPNPEKFDPERFSDTEKAKRHYYTYVPFGEGPRHCIGKRFALMQVRVALIVLIQNFKFEIADKMKLPVKFDPKSFIITPKGGVHLKISKVEQ